MGIKQAKRQNFDNAIARLEIIISRTEKALKESIVEDMQNVVDEYHTHIRELLIENELS